MTLIEWSAKYTTGDAEVDSQHQDLFRIFNSLESVILNGSKHELLVKVLDNIAAYVVKHFKTEEAIMLRSAYPGYERHKAIHDKLTRDTIDIITGYRHGKISLSSSLPQFLNDWLAEHIEIEDIQMIEHVRSMSVEPVL